MIVDRITNTFTRFILYFLSIANLTVWPINIENSYEITVCLIAKISNAETLKKIINMINVRKTIASQFYDKSQPIPVFAIILLPLEK